MSGLNYPTARKDETMFDDYHGTMVSDCYAWMENPDGEETKAFVEAQNSISLPHLKECPLRNKFFDRLTDLYNFPKYSCPFKKGSRYFYFMNTGLQNQSVMYVQETLDSEPKVFLDPNKLSEDGTVSLRGSSFTKDGTMFAYGLSNSGSDWTTIKFKDVETGDDLPDVLHRVKFSCMTWTRDNKGLFFNSYLEQEGKADGTETTSNVHQKLFYHRLGTKQSDDVLCGEFPDHPKWMSGAEISDDDNYLLLTISEGCDPVNRLWYVDMRTLDRGIVGIPDWIKLVDNFDAEYEYITNESSIFTFKTNLESPRYKLINIDINKPDKSNWTTLIEEHDKDVLEWVGCVNQDKLVVAYLRDVKDTGVQKRELLKLIIDRVVQKDYGNDVGCQSVLELRRLQDGQLIRKLPLDVGSVVGYSGRKEQNEMFYQFVSFLSPGIIYRYDFTLDDPHPEVFREIVVKGFDPSLFETSQIFYSSKDGTKIPMFIVHKKNLPLSGNHPTLLYGYGGFNISITPSFSVSRVIFMQNMGGVYVIANIRGGGEYGETWHKGGMLANKQNCFDDFQYAAKYLIEKKYTCAQKITINGGSNGGLLVAACINQRPDLFGCAVAQVGVMDMLKFHKYTIGHAWTTDFGCSDKEEQFKYLHKYSPLHNVRELKPGCQYPALLLLTGDHDDRVVPHHSLKYIATVQDIVGASKQQKNPLLIRVDTKSGHGSGKPTSKVIEESSDMYGFIGRSVGAAWTSQ